MHRGRQLQPRHKMQASEKQRAETISHRLGTSGEQSRGVQYPPIAIRAARAEHDAGRPKTLERNGDIDD